MTGKLKYLSSGGLVDTYGAGNFVSLKFSNIPEDATSVKVGMDPSEGTGLVEIIDNPDKNGVFKVTNKNTQKFVVEITTPEGVTRIEYSLRDLECLSNVPTIPEITSALSSQLNLWIRRLNGETIDPSLYDQITADADNYYKTNTEYNDEVDSLEDAMDGVD